MLRLLMVGLLMSASASLCLAASSGNVVLGGDFEDTAYLQRDYDTPAPDVDGPHLFNDGYDLGSWLTIWGPPSVCGTGSDNYTQHCGLAGFSTYDDPRDLAIDVAGDHNGVVNRGMNEPYADDIGDMNRSLDPTDAGNHVMEAVMFRPAWGQWIEAPANHVPGHIQFSFDLRQTNAYSANAWGRMYVYGVNTLPTNGTSNFDNGVLNPASLGGVELFRFTYGEFMEGNGDATGFPETPLFDYFGNWHHVDTDTYAVIPDPRPGHEGETIPGDPQTGEPDYLWWNGHLVTTELATTYQYYVVIGSPVIYDEGDAYWWSDAERVSEDSIMFDNVKLQLMTSNPSGDFNDDGNWNNLDIAPFITALTNLGAYEAAYPWADLTSIDPLVDGVINNLDIVPFITIITAGGQAIPEPATLGLLVLGGLALARRR